jgi:hypothetical protein
VVYLHCLHDSGRADQRPALKNQDGPGLPVFVRPFDPANLLSCDHRRTQLNKKIAHENRKTAVKSPHSKMPGYSAGLSERLWLKSRAIAKAQNPPKEITKPTPPANTIIQLNKGRR